jgi:hypothetical protein
MLGGEIKTPSTRSSRGRKKSSLLFSSSKTLKRNRLNRIAKQNGSSVLSDTSMHCSPEENIQRNDECIVRKERRPPLDMSGMLSTVRELEFDSSADRGFGRGFPHCSFEEVSIYHFLL